MYFLIFPMILIVIYKITKKQASPFFVIFLFALIGFLVTSHSINQRDMIRSYQQKQVCLEGLVYKSEQTEYGLNLYLNNVVFEVEIDRAKNINKEINHLGKIIVVTDDKSSYKIGQKIDVVGTVSLFNQARNFGNFDAEKYYESLGIFAKVSANNIRVTSSGHDGIRQNLKELREGIKEKLKDLCERTSGIFKICKGKSEIYSAMLLGDKSELDEEIRELYSLSGIAHILAISGLHISLVGMFLYKIFRKRFGFAVSSSVSIIVVVGFGLISGMGIATIRAVVMFGLKLLGEVLGRTYDYLSAISLSGLMLMLDNPFILYNTAFQMSFAAIIAITIVWPKVEKCLNLKNRFLKSVAFSINISAVMTPIVAYYYYGLPTYSPLLNLVIVPLMSVVIISGVFGMIAGSLWIWAGRILIFPGCAILELYKRICLLVEKIPYSYVIVGKPEWWKIVLYYLIFALTITLISQIREKYEKSVRERKKHIAKEGIDVIEEQKMDKEEQRIYIRFRFVLFVTYVVVNGIIYLHLPVGFYVTFLDVGQGDGIFIHTENGVNITVDGGSTSVNQVGKYRMIPFLKAKGIRMIDYAIMTHADTDHISGLVELLEQSDGQGISINYLVMPDISGKDEAYNQLTYVAKKHDVGILYISAGDCMQFGGVNLDCIAPKKGMSAEDRNDLSTVLSVKYQSFSMLLTGDIPSEVEEQLDLPLPNYTFLKAAHHGSKYSTSENFLKKVKPVICVISVGEHNLYGHPGNETLERLKISRSRVLRTDKHGGITVCSDGNHMDVNTFIKETG